MQKNNGIQLRSFIAFFISIFFFFQSASGQNLGYYLDYMDRLVIFDSGIINNLEHLAVKNIQVGGNYLIYNDPKGQLVHYSEGKSTILKRFPSAEFEARRYLLLNRTPQHMQVIFGNRIENLTPANSIEYALGDSIVGYIDFDRWLKVFYNGGIRSLTNMPIMQLKASDNTLAYVCDNGQFFVVYGDNEPQEVSYEPPKGISNSSYNFKMGNNLIAYVNSYNNFMLYDGENSQELEQYAPKSYQVGDDIVAYITTNDNFYVFYKGEASELMPIAPRSYRVFDNTLAYLDEKGFLNVFYKGENHIAARYTPPSWNQTPTQGTYTYEGVVPFTDLDGKLYAFYEGEVKAISKEIVQSYTQFGRVIVYETQNKVFNVYWNGNTY